MINWKVLSIALSLGILNVFSIPSEILAQSRLTNPLLPRVGKKDPLIPAGYGKRGLTSFEKYRIEQEIAKLDQTAQEELKQDNLDEAFEHWYRYLKLSRVLDAELEIENLGKVGKIAWQKHRSTEVQNIAERLIILQEELTKQEPLSSEFLDKFATAYQQLRYLDKAIAIYQQIIKNNIKADDLVAENKNLKTLGKLYLSRFDYANAANIYQELLALADQESNSAKEIKFYLNTLINIYDRTSQTDEAIAARKRLIEKYTISQNLTKIPALKIAIARDYETQGKQQRAIDAYNETFIVASKTQQFALASDALTRLGKIHQQNNNTDKAIATYNKLLKLQQQSYNYYGLINTYDILGKIHLKLNKKLEAKQYFQQGLELAKSLNYKVKYFNQQIQSLISSQ